jgi:hypothetical protein
MSLPYKELPPVEAGAMKTLPPGTGILIVTAFSLLIWACIASIFIMLWRAGVH